MTVEDAIRSRRSHKQFDGTPVARDVVEALLELAIWAPNHKRTEPWRFCVAHGPQRLQDLADAACAWLQGHAHGPIDAGLLGKQDKIRALLGGAAAVIAVGYARSPDDAQRDREDFAATACATQNLLLGATARGLGTLWSTNAALISTDLNGFWQGGAGEERIGAIVLGRPTLEMPALRTKTARDVTRWL